ncbi:hypothetical protein AX15_005594 [Amanita polypyramis BW_CC]|nr:hypothetical protein AX15_005594 [Amanita polypyramis BW_CC]
MHSSPFSVAGMSSGGGAHHHNSNLGGWGGTGVNPSASLTSSFSDSLTQSRSQYQPGYLMSASQNLHAQQGSPRLDDVPIVQTKAKLNQGLVRGTTSEFGMDSMFESSRKRQTLADEDAPPMTSVTDIPNETYADASPTAFQPKASTLGTSSLFKHRAQPSTSGANATQHPRQQQQTQEQQQQPLYIIVFGYPQDRYSVTVEYFKSLGNATEPDLNNEIMNCFKIGYHDPGDALRAVRKSGEVLCGCYMVGVKWADPAQAESLFSHPPLFRSTYVPPDTPLQQSSGPDTGMVIDSNGTQQPHYGINTTSVGTPIKLAPSAAAFRRTTMGTADKTPQQSQPGVPSSRSWIPGVPGALAGGSSSESVPASVTWSGGVPAARTGAKPSAAQNRGVLGQVSDLIFGW